MMRKIDDEPKSDKMKEERGVSLSERSANQNEPNFTQGVKEAFPDLPDQKFKDFFASVNGRETERDTIGNNKRETLKLEISNDLNELMASKFIGEFSTDKKFKIIRGYINQNESDRIFYTRFEQTEFSKKISVLIVHGYGHSGSFMEVI